MQKFETQHNNDSEIAILFQPKRSSPVPIVKRCGHRHPTRVWCNFTLICPWLLAASIVLVDEGKQRRKGWGGRKGKQRKDGQREEGGRRQPDEQTCTVIRAWGKEAGVMWIIHNGPHTFAMFLRGLGECITNHTPMESVCSTCNLIPKCGGGGGERAPGLHLHLITVATSLHLYIVYWWCHKLFYMYMYVFWWLDTLK